MQEEKGKTQTDQTTMDMQGTSRWDPKMPCKVLYLRWNNHSIHWGLTKRGLWRPWWIVSWPRRAGLLHEGSSPGQCPQDLGRTGLVMLLLTVQEQGEMTRQVQGSARKSSQEQQDTETRSMQEKGPETRLHIKQVLLGRPINKRRDKTGHR